jgi:hypothetical protein
MNLVAITRPLVGNSSPNIAGPRQFDRVDDFAAAISCAIGVAVPVIEAELPDVASGAYSIVFDKRTIPRDPAARARTVLINADRSSVLRDLEEFELAGAVEKHRYFSWRTSPGDEDGGGLFARRDLAEVMGATFAKGPFDTRRYGLYKTSRFRDLPTLIAGYLLELERQLA